MKSHNSSTKHCMDLILSQLYSEHTLTPNSTLFACLPRPRALSERCPLPWHRQLVTKMHSSRERLDVSQLTDLNQALRHGAAHPYTAVLLPLHYSRETNRRPAAFCG